MTGKRKYNRTPQVFAITKRLVILSAEHERIRNTLQKKETDCRAPNGARNDRATAYCTHHTVFVATKRLVILSAEHERIRNTLQKKETDCHTPYGVRNDRATAYCTHHTVFVATKRLVILSAEHERIRNTLQKKETDCRSRLHGFAMTGSVRTAYRASRGIRNDKRDRLPPYFTAQ